MSLISKYQQLGNIPGYLGWAPAHNRNLKNSTPGDYYLLLDVTDTRFLFHDCVKKVRKVPVFNRHNRYPIYFVGKKDQMTSKEIPVNGLCWLYDTIENATLGYRFMLEKSILKVESDIEKLKTTLVNFQENLELWQQEN
jgi:hypothetical protein